MNASVCAPPPPPPPPVEMPMITGAVGSHATTANANTSPVNRIGCIGASFLVALVAVSYPVLIAAELRDLLEPDQVEGLEVTWLPADKAIAKGDWVAIVPLLSRWVGGTQLKYLPKLRIIANCAVGYDNVDLVAAEMRKVIVTNTPDVLTDATADLTWALILACARRLVEGIDLVRSGQWTGWHPEQLLGVELRGRTLGLFGAGRIGQAVGRRAVPFGLRIIYAARTAKPEFERDTGAVCVEWPRLLAESDILSLHAPSTPETKGIVNQDTLRQMRREAILVNTARGDLIREEALAIALEEGRLGAAGLDVYAEEPAIHPRLRAAPRTVLLPHIGSATHDTRRKMAAIAVANVQAVLRGGPPLTPVYR
jgi:glyoxylate reductase